VKKILVLVAVIMLFGAMTVYGQAIGDLKGKMAVGGFLDFGIGFGDVFKEYGVSGVATFKSSLGLSFGGQFLYGLAPKIAVKGLFDYQTESYKATLLGMEAKSSYHILEISANGMYFFSPEKKMCPYVEAGPGLYSAGGGGSSSSNLGVNAGVGGMYMINDKVAIDAGGRFHMIFTTGKSTTFADIHAGVSFFLGGK